MRSVSNDAVLLVLGGLAVATIGALSPVLGQILPADRATTWNPGLNAVGGIPVRSTICATLSPREQGLDDRAQIQSAIDACPTGQAVQLTAGTFIVNGPHYLLINKDITLRGAGPERTTLAKTDGAKPFQAATSADPVPLIIVGPARYSTSGHSSDIVSSSALTADAAKGGFEVTVDRPQLFKPGQIVLLDETSGAGWQKDPQGRGEIWAAPDWRVVWQKHRPPAPGVDHFSPDAFPTTPQTAGSWFSRADRPTAEIKEVAAVSGATVRFTTPVHISYRTGHRAELSSHGHAHVKFAGVEDLKLIGGDNGNLSFVWAAYSWARNVDNTQWHGVGFSFHSSFRVELRDYYVHDAAWAQVGGGGYAISLSGGSSEILIENGIAVRANKVMVARSSGAGSVVAYNYMDMSYINSNGSWIEAGLNASHMVGPHHVLFEGNLGHNAESDDTHGNSILHTFFRNHLRCIRAPFINQAGGKIDDALQVQNGPKRCAGLASYSYWMSFIGNVLGAPNAMGGWADETTFASGRPGIWMLGWDSREPYRVDTKVAATALRHGNFDYLTNTVRWDPATSDRALPASLYLSGKPKFFGAGRGYTWPWVEPAGQPQLHVLPAKARYDAGTPFTQP